MRGQVHPVCEDGWRWQYNGATLPVFAPLVLPLAVIARYYSEHMLNAIKCKSYNIWIRKVSVINNLAEAKILAAIKSGELNNLPGQGMPLQLDDVSGIPEELRAGYRILKNAGYLPAELELRKEVRRVEQLLAGVNNHCEKKALVLKLSLLKSQL